MLKVFADRVTASRAAAQQAGTAIRNAIAGRGEARIVAATAASQLAFLEALTATPGIDWTRVEAFHLDEYIGLPPSHPGSFRGMLRKHLIEPTGITRYHLLDGEGDAPEVARRVGRAIAAGPIDVAFVGIGENGHLAFNDPPADFQTEEPYLVVALDEASRRQQVAEAWFADLSQVPTHALSMSVRQILKSREVIAIVPDARKAQAVHLCFDGPITPEAPASILRTHPQGTIYLDLASAALLDHLRARPDVSFPEG
jgi:glucosamine-6-phosphate deaminase